MFTIGCDQILFSEALDSNYRTRVGENDNRDQLVDNDKVTR